MNMGLYDIKVNTTDVTLGQSIAAYLTSASGALITSTTIGGKVYSDQKAPSDFLSGAAYSAGTDYLNASGILDSAGNWRPWQLNASGELPVAATFNAAGDYAEDSAHVSGDIGLFSLGVRRDVRSSGVSSDGDYASFNVNAVGEMWVKDADSLAQLVLANSSLDAIEASVAAIDIDTSSIIVELQAANASLDAIESDVDAIRVEQLDQGITLDAILADTATIDSQTLSIQNTLTALSKAEDAAHVSGDQGIQSLAVRKDAQGSNVSADGDYASVQQWSEGSLKVVDIRNGAVLQQQVSVTSTAAAVPTTALANRKTLMLQNTGGAKCWIGSATVTTSGATAGIEMPGNSFIEMEVGPAVSIYAIKSGAGGNNMNVLELA